MRKQQNFVGTERSRSMQGQSVSCLQPNYLATVAYTGACYVFLQPEASRSVEHVHRSEPIWYD
jgi:hypothetical protein